MPSSTHRHLHPRQLISSALAVAVLAAVAVVAAPSDASACSCARPLDGARTYMKGADTVFVGRVVRVSAKPRAVHFRVLAQLKGKPLGKRHTLKQGLSPCDPSFRKGEVRVVLLHRGSAGLCSGNFALRAQIADLPTYLQLARGKAKRSARRAEVRAALLLLRQYLHGRKRIPLASKTLPKSMSLRIGKSALAVTRALPKHALIVRVARCVGSVCLVKGSYPREGVVYSVLLERRAKKIAVLERVIAERSSKRSKRP